MKILIVDDDKIFRDLVAMLMKESGYRAICAEDGMDGWEKLKKVGADIVVLDVNMPRMDGFEFLSAMRNEEKFKNIPVLMLTIRGFNDDQINGYTRGADDYLTKPFDNAILIAKIKALARRILK